jgi:hypothetical protein
LHLHFSFRFKPNIYWHVIVYHFGFYYCLRNNLLPLTLALLFLPLLAVPPWLSYPGSPVLAALFLFVKFCLSSAARSVLPIQFCVSISTRPALLVWFCLSCLCLSCSACLVLTVLSGCPFLAVLSFLSCPACPILVVLS